MLNKLINLGFAVAVVLAFGLMLFGLSGAHADETRALQELRAASVHISVGSGSIVEGASGKHYILTNDHVCRPARWGGKIAAHYEDGTTVIGKIVAEDAVGDLCAAEVPLGRPALKLGKSPAPGQRVYTRGFPGFILSENSGVIGGKAAWDDDVSIEEVGDCPKGTKPEYYYNGYLDRVLIGGCKIHNVDTLTTLYARPGSSGSPVVNESGQIVGVVKSRHAERKSDYQTGIVEYEPLYRMLSSL